MSTDGLRQPLSGGASIAGIDDSVEIYCFINQYVGVQMWWLHGPPFNSLHSITLRLCAGATRGSVERRHPLDCRIHFCDVLTRNRGRSCDRFSL